MKAKSTYFTIPSTHILIQLLNSDDFTIFMRNFNTQKYLYVFNFAFVTLISGAEIVILIL